MDLCSLFYGNMLRKIKIIFGSMIINVSFFLVTSISLSGQDSNEIQGHDYPNSRYSIGGEFRLRLRSFRNINFGDMPYGVSDYDTYLNMRGNIFGEFYIRQNIKMYAMIYSAHTLFKDDLSASDKDLLAMGQIYVDIDTRSELLKVRIGRQQMSYGSGKILGTSDNPNVPKTFDGIRSIINHGSLTGEIFIVKPFYYSEGIFDNRAGSNTLMYGTYFVKILGVSNFIDVYIFGNHTNNQTIANEEGDEKRFTFGGRTGKNKGVFTYETELAGQFGKFSNKYIKSFMVSAGFGYSWSDARFKPRIQFRSTVYNGDKDSADLNLGFFRPLYARPPVNNMAPFGPSNIFLIVPEYGMTIFDKIATSVRYYGVWRLRSSDGLYSSRMDRMTREPDRIEGRKGNFITSGLYAQAEYPLNQHFNIMVSTGTFFAGEYLHNTGIGKDVMATFITFSGSF